MDTGDVMQPVLRTRLKSKQRDIFDHMSMARSVISDYFSNTLALRVRSSYPGGERFLSLHPIRTGFAATYAP